MTDTVISKEGVEELARDLLECLPYAPRLYRAQGALIAQVARIAELEAERDECLNQMDSLKHSVTVLETRGAEARQVAPGDQCEACGREYHTIYSVPSDLWAKIAPRPETLGVGNWGGGILCSDCASNRARRILPTHLVFTANIWSENVNGEARQVTVQEAAKVLIDALGPEYNPNNQFWGAVIDYIMKNFNDDAHVRGSDGILAALRALSGEQP